MRTSSNLNLISLLALFCMVGCNNQVEEVDTQTSALETDFMVNYYHFQCVRTRPGSLKEHDPLGLVDCSWPNVNKWDTTSSEDGVADFLRPSNAPRNTLALVAISQCPGGSCEPWGEGGRGAEPDPSAMCWDRPDNQIAAGTVLQVYPCHYQASQTWVRREVVSYAHEPGFQYEAAWFRDPDCRHPLDCPDVAEGESTLWIERTNMCVEPDRSNGLLTLQPCKNYCDARYDKQVFGVAAPEWGGGGFCD